MMLLLGMVGGALTYGALLAHFTEIKLIQVIQGTALATMVLNVIALWKQEARDPSLTARDRVQPTFKQAWADFSETAECQTTSVGAWSRNHRLQHAGHPAGTLWRAGAAPDGRHHNDPQRFARHRRPQRLWPCRSASGTRHGSLPSRRGRRTGRAGRRSAPLSSPRRWIRSLLFAIGTALIGFGAGLFGHCTLTAAMGTARSRADRPGAGRLGRRAGLRRRIGHRRRRPDPRRHLRSWRPTACSARR